MSEGRLASLGWTPAFAADAASLGDETLSPARVVVEHRGRYRLLGADGEVDAWPPQGMRRKVSALDKPGVGDWVAIRQGQGGDLAHIVSLLPRRTALVRQAAGDRAEPQLVAANLDYVLVVTSMNQDFNPRRIERYLAVVRASGAEPVVVLNKADLQPDGGDSFVDALRESAPGVRVIRLSALLGEGLDALQPLLGRGRTLGLVGSSGVGKSTLLNRLLGQQAQVVSDIREHDARGRHTTTHRELFLLPGDQGVVIDTPGMRELQLWDEEGITDTFPDIEALTTRCRFRDCGHTNEPGCAIAEALEEGTLSPERWASYSKLQAEAEAQEARRDRHSRQQERRQGKMYKQVQEEKRLQHQQRKDQRHSGELLKEIFHKKKKR